MQMAGSISSSIAGIAQVTLKVENFNKIVVVSISYYSSKVLITGQYLPPNRLREYFFEILQTSTTAT